MSTPYHAGETLVQTQAGEVDAALMNAAVIRDFIPPNAVSFLKQQQYCALGWRSQRGDVWATFLAGEPGFASTDEGRRTLSLALQDPGDILQRIEPFCELGEGDYLGVVFTDLSTRRRLRVEGRVLTVARESIVLIIEQAYPNCPKYIQRRMASRAPLGPQGPISRGAVLSAELRKWIESADTCFVATTHPTGRADASHRGGPPGFVRVTGDTLHMPDYRGNSMFKTLGNLALNPRAGLTFVDFDSNRQLRLSGTASLFMEGDHSATPAGTGRWWRFETQQWSISPLNLAFAWMSAEASSFNP